MGGVVQDAKRHPYHLGHALAGPHLAAESVGFRATMQRLGQTGQLLGGQPTGCSRGGLEVSANLLHGCGRVMVLGRMA